MSNLNAHAVGQNRTFNDGHSNPNNLNANKPLQNESSTSRTSYGKNRKNQVDPLPDSFLFNGIRGPQRLIGFKSKYGNWRCQRWPCNDQQAVLYEIMPVFDVSIISGLWPQARNNEANMTELTNLIMKKYGDLAPSTDEKIALASFMQKVLKTIENLCMAPDLLPTCKIADHRLVGSLRTETVISGHNSGDILIIFESLPSYEIMNSLANKIIDDIRDEEPQTVIHSNPKTFGIELLATDLGHVKPPASITLIVGTILTNIEKLDPELHYSEDILRSNMLSVPKTAWFEKCANNLNVKILVFLLKDLRWRYNGLRPMSVWVIQLLAHYTVFNTPSRKPLPIDEALIRALSLISSGIFLNGSSGIVDPIQPTTRAHTGMSFEEQDLLCATGQTLLRVLLHKGYKDLLGYGPQAKALCDRSTMYGTILVSPLQTAYDKDIMSEFEDSAKENAAQVTSEKNISNELKSISELNSARDRSPTPVMILD